MLIRETDHRVVTVDKLTYAGNLESLAEVQRLIRVTGSCRWTSCDAAAMRALFAEQRPDGVIHLAAESHVDRSIDGAGDFIETNVVGTFTLLQESAALLAERSARPTRRRSASCTFRRTKCSARSARRVCSPRTRPTRRNRRTRRARRRADHFARAWFHTYGLPIDHDQLLEQLRAVSVSGKADPAHDSAARFTGKPLPVYGAARTCATGCSSTIMRARCSRVLESGVPGETYNIGGGGERTNLDVVRDDLRAARRAGAATRRCRPHAR